MFAGNCTDNNPLGKDTSRNAFYPDRRTGSDRRPAGWLGRHEVPLYTLPVHVHGLGREWRLSGATATATEATSTRRRTSRCALHFRHGHERVAARRSV